MYIRHYNETDFQKRLIAMSSTEFDKFMCEKFPMLFAQRYKPMNETCMCWGFCIGKGWYPLLHEMCEKIMLICNGCDFKVEFVQIKEKFGSGRFYFQGGNIGASSDNNKSDVFYDLISDVVSNYEDISNHICAETGKWYDDKISLDGWIYDCCAKAIIELEPERKEAVEAKLYRTKKIKTINNSLYMFDDAQINQICDYIENCMQPDSSDVPL